MKIGHTEIFVKDPMQSKDFYTDILGFEVDEIQGDKYVWLTLDDNVFLLRPGNNNLLVDIYKDTNSAIVLYTDDLDRTRDELKAKGLKFKGTDGSDRCLTFTDPDGNWFQLVNPVEH
ncbi:MAG: VOC family protein [Ignavibacteriae bacterium]|nr:MAG: VOC family protein [Ignavibacteriota bacterium]